MSLTTLPAGVPAAPAASDVRQRAWPAIFADRALWLLLAGGLVLRLVLLASTSTTPLKVADERHYAQIASSLVQRGEFAFEPGKLTSMRPPLYPAFIASLWAVAGAEDPQIVRVIQVPLGLLLVVLTYLLADRLFGRAAAVAAAAVVCFYPSLLYAGILVLTEILFTVFLLLVVLLFTETLQRPRMLTATVMGVVLGCAALTRSVLWPFPVLLAPFLVLVIPGSWMRRSMIAACCVGGFALVVAPWAVRNTLLQRTLTVVDTMGGMNLRMGNYEHTPEDRIWDAVSLTGEKGWSYELGQTEPDALQWTVGQKDKWAQRAALTYMLDHPSITLRRSAIKFADFWGLERELIAALQGGLYAPPRWFAVTAIALVLVAYPLVAVSAAIGAWRAVPSERRTHWLMIGLIGFVMAIHSVVFGHSRYHLPLVPLLAVYAAAGWTSGSWRELLARPRLALLPGVTVAVLVAIWSHEVFVRDAARIQAVLQTWL